MQRVNGSSVFIIKSIGEINLEIERFTKIHEYFENLNIN
jgi:hypothetical protein